MTEIDYRQYIRDGLKVSVSGGGAGGQVVGMGNRTIHGVIENEGISISMPLYRSQHKARELMIDIVELIIKENQ